MTTYHIEPARETLHGSFSRDYPPVLTIDAGDTVVFRTLDAAWTLEPPASAGAQARRFEPRVKGRDDGHALCGPIALRGARPGMTLEIVINEVRPGTWGWTGSGGRETAINRRLGLVEQRTELLWTLDADALTGVDQHGDLVALRPFMGVLGMPPAEAGVHATIPPRAWGGNIDCRELVAGSTLYLPIAVPGALFSVGDGHAVQGDGEVSGVAIECPMERVSLTFHLRDDLHLTTPRASTPAGWITFGFHEDLHEAAMVALEAMVDLLGEQYRVPRARALALASLVVDLRVTQLVNSTLGIHALLAPGALR